MKKLSVLLVAAVVALSASAGVNFKTNHAVKKGNKISTELKMKVKDLKAKNAFRVITQQPEGELKSYNRAGQYDYVSSGSLYCGQQTGNRMDIVYAEDGKVYLKNIICGIGSYFGDSWVEGTIEDNVITVPLGQSIYWSDTYQADVVLCWGSTHGGEAENTIYFDIDDRVEEVTYLIDGETITMQGTEGSTGGDYYNIEDYFGTGLSAYWTDDDSWSGFIEWNTVLTEREPVVTPTVITEIPEDAKVYTYARQGYCIYNSWFYGIGMTEVDGKLKVAFSADGKKAYIQNPVWWHDSYGSWVEGDYDWSTLQISVPVGQYLSWNESYEYGIQLFWGDSYVYEDVDEEGETGYYLGTEVDDRTDFITLQIDDDVIGLMGSYGDPDAEFPYNFEASGLYTIWSDDLEWTGALEFTSDELWGKLIDIKPAVPANPTADEWYDCGDESGYSRFYFTLPTTDVDGNPIDQEYLSISIYVDNGDGPEIFTFDYDHYNYDISEDMTEIPYEIYSGGYDFNSSYFWFYRTNEGDNPLFTENIGIQVFYTVDGIKNASEIAWLYNTPEPPTPEDPHMTGYWLVMVQADGTEEYVELNMAQNGDYVTIYDVIYPMYYNVGNFYFMINGVAYGAAEDCTDATLGNSMLNPLTEGTNNTYQVGNGYSYVLGIHFVIDETTGEIAGYTAYVAVGGPVSVDELNAGKTVANVRYFNVAGQEMAQPSGMTIQVTTYTDGTTSAAKVMK
ncbi:MAG: hypothetical protein IKZ92_03325 [Muribaculaceae bacterium]|nr:hypothetical protein [Muribaculaceae bacterium]